MKNTYLYALWGAFYLLCAALGVFSVPDWVGIIAGLLFFVPPAVILYRARRDGKGARLIRNLSIAWLAVTLVLLVLNILSVTMSELAGTVLYYLLAVLSAPMVCGVYWVTSLFLWACLLVVSLRILKK